jgi:acetyl esterase/lipase
MKFRSLLLIGAATSLVVGGNLHAQFPTKDLAGLRTTYTYKSVNGSNILADVYKTDGRGLHPSILLIHGGSLIAGARTTNVPHIGEYLAAGYNVVSIDYRLAPETKLPGIVADVEDAYRWIRTDGPELFGGDPSRIAVIGHSAGAYLALVAGYRFQPQPRAIISFYGFSDITGSWMSLPNPSYVGQIPMVSESVAFDAVKDVAVSSAPTPDFSVPLVDLADGRGAIYLYAVQRGIWPQLVSGHHPVVERDWFAQFEPIRNVTTEYSPTMLLHGEADTEVPFDQSVRMAAELQRAGVDHEFATNPDWNHGFDDVLGLQDPAVARAFSRVLGFLAEHLEK